MKYSLRLRSTAALLTVTAALLGAALLGSVPVSAQPLKAAPDGSGVLYQRVLVKPGAELRAGPEAGATRVLPAPQVFQVLYVFDRRGGWVEVGGDAGGAPLGWLSEEATLPFDKTIVAAFNNPAGRERSLIFKNRTDLETLLKDDNRADLAQTYAQAASAGRLVPGSGVIALEPETDIDIAKNFYILPILADAEGKSARTVRIGRRKRGKILQIASVRTPDRPAAEVVAQDPQSPEPTLDPAAVADPSIDGSADPGITLRDYTIGIVFVVDTTQSMGPQIQATKEAVAQFVRETENSPMGKRLRFGLVGFRDSTKLAPTLGYTTKTYLPLSTRSYGPEFLAALDRLDVATASSVGFDEDAYAGVYEALNGTDWEPHGGRYIFLVTDAGPRSGPESASPLKADALRGLADLDAKKVAIYVWHLKTQSAEREGNLARAAQAYTALSGFGTERAYFPIQGGPSAYRAAIERVTRQFVGQAQAAFEGRRAGEAALQSPPAQPAPTPPTPEDAATAEAAETATTRIGLAMQLAFLGRQQATAAPEVVQGWMLDKDPANPDRASIDIRLLLTKNQLATLRDLVSEVIDQAERSMIDPNRFFLQLRAAVTVMARDPKLLLQEDFDTLGGALGGLLDGLPYESALMAMDERQWISMAGGAQRAFIDDLKERLALYEEIHDDPANWYALAEGVPDGEHVYAMPLRHLP